MWFNVVPSAHIEEELKLYSDTCGVLTCFACAIKGGRHHDHKYRTLKDAFETYKEEVTSYMKLIES